MKPYYQTDRFSLYKGDCRSVLPYLSDCSVDSVVCDPPYELGFMGKGWDRSGIAYDLNVWLECLRVLKPGSHLLAFGGSRTYHRLACAIEDAGFEIRDQIQYIYGSGFPKSLNVSKNLREQESVCICNEHNGDLLSLQNRISDVESVVETHQDADVFPTVQREVARAGMGQARLQGGVSAKPGEPQSSSATGSKQSRMEGRRNLFSETRELCADQVCAMPDRVHADGSQGWICDGAPSDYGPMDRATANTNGSGSPRRSQSSEQPANKSAFMAQQSEPQTSGAWPICGRCGKPVVPEGLGSALKPAHEPIVLARKPFNSTLIHNVLQHGTGGLNIDGCRIETSAADQEYINERIGGFNQTQSIGGNGKYQGGEVMDRSESYDASKGRWPANVIHDGSNEVLAAFPDAPGQQGDLSGHSKDRLSKGIFGDMKSARDAVARLDSGSAARFFYCAKATQEDRNEGLEDLAPRVTDEVHKRPRTELNDPRRHGVTPRQNFHPTVKPTDLMRYLCRLVTPPGGVVLDPFCGSGSTGKAAMLEGLRFIGIELSEDYCQLAQRRIEAVTKQGLLFTTA